METMWTVSQNVRSALSKDGGVLLDTRAGRCHSLNIVGACIWAELEAAAAGASTETLVKQLLDKFTVPRERLAADVDTFLSGVEKKGLVRSEAGGTRPSGSGFLQPIRQVLPQQSSREALPEPAAGPSRPMAVPQGWKATGTVLLSWFGLVAADVIVRTGGFRALRGVVKRWPRKQTGTSDIEEARKISSLVDLASTWYFKHSWCLQRSAVTACVLRLFGADADLVIGCRKIPFAAHAWVEVGGAVVNDNPRLNIVLAVLEHC